MPHRLRRQPSYKSELPYSKVNMSLGDSETHVTRPFHYVCTLKSVLFLKQDFPPLLVHGVKNQNPLQFLEDADTK